MKKTLFGLFKRIKEQEMEKEKKKKKEKGRKRKRRKKILRSDQCDPKKSSGSWMKDARK